MILHGDPQFAAQRRNRSAAGGMTPGVEPGDGIFAGVLGQIGLIGAGVDHFDTAVGRGAAEHHDIEQRIGAEPVGAGVVLEPTVGAADMKVQTNTDQVPRALDMGDPESEHLDQEEYVDPDRLGNPS